MALRFEPDVSHADWWATPDAPWDVRCTMGPSGFAAYAQVLHPLDQPTDQAIASALMDVEGDLDDSVLRALVERLAEHTGTPGDCFFGLWEGYAEIQGGSAVSSLTMETDASGRVTYERAPAAFPPEVTEGPRVRIPARDYLLFRGPLHDAGDWGATSRINSPNLIWPADQSWFLATEVDATFTVVGGSATLVDAVAADERLLASRVPWGRLADPREVQQ